MKVFLGASALFVFFVLVGASLSANSSWREAVLPSLGLTVIVIAGAFALGWVSNRRK